MNIPRRIKLASFQKCGEGRKKEGRKEGKKHTMPILKAQEPSSLRTLTYKLEDFPTSESAHLIQGVHFQLEDLLCFCFE